MKFGLVLTGMPSGSCSAQEQVFNTLEVARAARDNGFSTLVVGQHFVAPPYRYLQTMPLLGRLTSECRELELATGVLLLSLLNPVQTAEELATIDVMSGGRLIAGVGLGYRDEEFTSFNVDRNERGARQAEALAVMKALWSGGPVHHDGRFFQVHVEGASILPLQRPGPVVWKAAMTATSFKNALRQGTIPYVGPRVEPDELRAWLAASGWSPNVQGGVPLRRELYLGTSGDPWAEAVRHVGERFAVYRKWGLDRDTSGESSQFQDYLRHRIVAGTPDECLAEIERYKRLGVSHLVFRCQWPSLAHEEVLRMIDLAGRHLVAALD